VRFEWKAFLDGNSTNLLETALRAAFTELLHCKARPCPPHPFHAAASTAQQTLQTGFSATLTVQLHKLKFTRLGNDQSSSKQSTRGAQPQTWAAPLQQHGSALAESLPRALLEPRRAPRRGTPPGTASRWAQSPPACTWGNHAAPERRAAPPWGGFTVWKASQSTAHHSAGTDWRPNLWKGDQKQSPWSGPGGQVLTELSPFFGIAGFLGKRMSLERYSFSLCTLACRDSVDLLRRRGSTEIPIVRANFLLMPASWRESAESAPTGPNATALRPGAAPVTSQTQAAEAGERLSTQRPSAARASGRTDRLCRRQQPSWRLYFNV